MTKYYSRSKQKFIDIATMTDQHVRNAFIEKCKHEPAEDAIYAQQQEERASRLQDRVIELERHKKDLRQSLDDALMDSNAKDRRIAYLEKLLQAKNFVFSEIPNTPENLKMLKLLKKHINKDMYRLRWRGQYLVDWEDWRKYVDGQPLSKSKCIRVYIDNLSAYGSTEGFNLDEIDKILSGLKDPTLIDYFEEMKFHIEECQQKMSEIE
jgi:DNA-binding transcriptional MerR regulator